MNNKFILDTVFRSLKFFFSFKVIVVVIPLVVISIFNTLIIMRLYHETDNWTSAKLKLHEQEMSYKELRDKKVQIENFKMTWMLVIISMSFILLTLPHTLIYFAWTIPRIGTQTSSPSIFFFKISPDMMKFTELLYIFNHSINFFLYTITRHSFRKVLKRQLTLTCFKKMWEYSGYKKKVLTQTLTKAYSKPTKNAERTDSSTPNHSLRVVSTDHVDQIKTDAVKEVIDYESYWDLVPLKNPNASKWNALMSS